MTAADDLEFARSARDHAWAAAESYRDALTAAERRIAELEDLLSRAPVAPIRGLMCDTCIELHRRCELRNERIRVLQDEIAFAEGRICALEGSAAERCRAEEEVRRMRPLVDAIMRWVDRNMWDPPNLAASEGLRAAINVYRDAEGTLR